MGQKGQSLVEFAISLVVILILLSGAVELGMALFQYIQLRDAAQEGALYGSICQDVPEIERRVRSASDTPLNMWAGDVLVKVDFVEDNAAVKVEVSYVHPVFMPFFAGREIPLTAHVTDTILVRGDCP